MPHKLTVFRFVALFRETRSVSDGEHSGRPTALNNVNVGNIRHCSVQAPRQF